MDTQQIPLTMRFCHIRTGKDFETDFESLLSIICGADRGAHDLEILHGLISRLVGPAEGIIATVEEYHVDSTYRDLYYTQYARRHCDVSRFTHRLSFFDYFIEEDGSFEELYNVTNWTLVHTDRLQDAYLGSVIISPVAWSLVCKAYLEPSRSMYWPSPTTSGGHTLVRDSAYLRLTEYSVNIAGKKLGIQAFPYHTQDGEVLSCAEVTLLNLTRYYSNEFAGYPIVEPSDILDAERRRAYSRVIPSTGLSYQTLCSILCDFGFRPELYDQQRVGRDAIATRQAQSRTQQLIHTYLESGIPVAVNVEPASDPNNGHSLVVIGHSGINLDLKESARENAMLIRERTVRDEGAEESVHMGELPFGIRLMYSSDLYDSCVVIDDNQDPYSMRNYSSLSIHPQMHTARFIAPIQRGMTVDAMDAITRFESILRDPADGVASWAENWMINKIDSGAIRLDDEGCVEVAARIFLASTRRFKFFRSNTLMDMGRRAFYASVPLPHYVWTCELFLLVNQPHSPKPEAPESQENCLMGLADISDQPHAFAEIVIDATASRTTTARDSVLIKHFPQGCAYRMPDNPHGDMRRVFGFHDEHSFAGIPAYTQNLTHVVSEHQV